MARAKECGRTVHRNRATAQRLRLGYFDQNQPEHPQTHDPPRMHLQRLNKQIAEDSAAARVSTEQELRSYLGGFGFIGDQTLAPVGPFSGGEKARLVLALLIYQRPNLLLLDEPTNHLDLEMREALAEALQEFSGAMVIVSHDRHLLRVTCDRLIMVHDQSAEDFPLSLDDYPKWLNDQNKIAQNPEDEIQTTSTENNAASKKDKKRLQAEQRKKLQPLKNKIKKAETELDKLHARQSELEQQLADPDIYADNNKQKLQDCLNEKVDIDKQSDAVENTWMEAAEELETLINSD